MNAKKLFIDIETSPIIAYVWQKSLYNTNIRNEQVIKDMQILSFAAKWADDNRVMYFENRSGNDKRLLLELHKLLDAADIVIVQNGKAFDLPTIKSRMLIQGIKPPSPFRVFDTFLEAKKTFSFTYNSLDYLASAMGCAIKKLKHNRFPGIELWKECLANNELAWLDMKKYNIHDVLALEEVYERMKPWAETHPNVGIWVVSKDPVCPVCGGSVERRGVRVTNTSTYQQYRCTSCGKYSRGRVALNSKESRRKQLA